MLNQILAAGFLIGLCVMLFYTPAIFTRSILRLDLDEDDRLTAGENVTCWVPIFNVIKAERYYTGRVSFVGISVITCILSFAIRMFAVYKLTENYTAQVITIALFLISLVAIYITNAVLVFMVLNDGNIGSMLDRILKALFFPLGQWYIGTYLAKAMKHYNKREDTFR